MIAEQQNKRLVGKALNFKQRHMQHDRMQGQDFRECSLNGFICLIGSAARAVLRQ